MINERVAIMLILIINDLISVKIGHLQDSVHTTLCKKPFHESIDTDFQRSRFYMTWGKYCQK